MPDATAALVQLPTDDAFIPSEPIQWWYWTGHLMTSAGARFGFEVCFFAFHADVLLRTRSPELLALEGWVERATGYPGFQTVNVALTDVGRQQYLYGNAFTVGHPRQLNSSFGLRADHKSITAVGGGGRDTLHADLEPWGFDLSLVNDNAAHPPVLQYGGRCHNYGFGGYTYYYTRPFMQATGTIRLGREVLPVTGDVWFDRQYGDLTQAFERGWTWMALMLDDGRQVTIADLTGAPSELYASVAQGAALQLFSSDSVTVVPLDHWTSLNTGIPYPSRWQLTSPAGTFIVSPEVPDQEMIERPYPPYWEGTCTVSTTDGRPIGRAYVELSGFTKPR